MMCGYWVYSLLPTPPVAMARDGGGIDKAKVTNKCENAVVRLPKCFAEDTVLLQKDYI
jgi:hypothetical protein